MKTVTNAANQEYDSPWKDILEAFFPQFMAFFFAEAHRQIDWVMTLPTDLDEQFQTELLHFEEEAKMQYVSGIERRAIERGLRKGLQTGALENGRKAIKEVLNARFGAASTAVADHLEQIDDEEDLRRLLRLAVTIESPEAFAEELAAEINQEKEDNN